MQALILGWLANHWLLIAAVLVGIAAIANPVLVWKFKAWILLAVVLWWGWTGHAAYDHLALQVQTDKATATAEIATARALASESARTEEQTRAKAVNAVASAYERGKTDAKATADRVAAGLLAGNLRLREQWRGCVAPDVPGIAAGPGRVDGGAELRAASAGRIVGAVAACEAQVIGLQGVVRADRNQ